MSTQEEIVKQIKEFKEFLIPSKVLFASKADVDALTNRMYLAIGIAAVILAGWSWLLYQSLNGTSTDSQVAVIASLSLSGLVLFFMHYVAKAFSDDASGWFDKIPALRKDAEEYIKVRANFFKAIEYIVYVFLAYAVVSLFVVVNHLYEQQYLPNFQQYLPNFQQYVPDFNQYFASPAPMPAPMPARPLRRKPMRR